MQMGMKMFTACMALEREMLKVREYYDAMEMVVANSASKQQE